MSKAGLIMSGIAQGMQGLTNASDQLNGNPQGQSNSGNILQSIFGGKGRTSGVGPTLPAPQEWSGDSTGTSLGLGRPNRGMLSRSLFNERKGL